MLSRQSILIFVLTILSVLGTKAQNSMGVGTDTPNQNAVLELVSPTGNQGFLVTRYTTAERTATSFTSNLSASDNGLMVFDTDENTFYVWIETQWQSISNQAVSAGSGISIDGSGVITNTGDLDITNEIQDLDLTSNILTITNNGSATAIDLTPYLDDTNTQLTESEVDGFVANNGFILAEEDGSITNEIQDLDLTSDILTITNNGSATAIDLTPYLDDTNTQLTESEVDGFVANNGFLLAEEDGSITNEIQDLDLTSDILTITNNGSATNIDLSSYKDNTDAQTAGDVPYDNTVTSLLISADVQSALDEVATNFNDVGVFTGGTITDNTDVVSALKELEAAVESPASISLQDAYDNGASISTGAAGAFSVSGTEAISLSAGSGQNLSLTTTGNILLTGGNASINSSGDATISGTLSVASGNLTVNASGNLEAQVGTFFNGLVSPSLTLSGTNSVNLTSATQTIGSANLTIPDLGGVNSTLALTSDLSLQQAYNNGATITTSSTPINVNGPGAISLGSSAGNIALVTAANLEFSAANFSLLSTGDMSVSGGLTINDGLTGNINPALIVERTDGNSASAIQFLNADGNINIGMTPTEDFAVSAPGNNIGLAGDYFRISNTGDVGIGVVNPSAKLDVNGTAEINGDLTAFGNVNADSYKYNNALTRRVTIGVHQFRPEILTGDVAELVVGHGNGAVAGPFISGNSDPDAHLSAPVSLPNGAVLTSFEAQLYQSPTSSNPVTMELYRKSLAGAPELMSTVTYSTTPGTTQLVSETDFVGLGVIDNTNYQYWLRFTGEGGDSLLSYTAGVRLTYTITSLD